jgi:serine protease Do
MPEAGGTSYEGNGLTSSPRSIEEVDTRMNKSGRIASALGIGVAIGLSLSLINPLTTPIAPSHAQAKPAAAASATIGSFAKLAEAVKPAVINISVRSNGTGRTSGDAQSIEEFYRRFFGGDAPGRGERGPRRGLGSGVIVDPSGIALTNAHVVEEGSSIEVVTVDGAKHTAKVLGVDKKTDLAVLQLDGGNTSFPFVALGDSDEAQVGDWVIAVGSPFGLQATVTSGIISAKARQIGAGPYDDFIQTDAAINPGNSGGPLVNMRGQVIGINTAIVARGSGIGFAIPSNLARRVATELRASGKVTRGWLGVSLQPLSPELATSFGVKESKGALVSDVSAGSPAARAGLKSGDVILEFNGKKVDDPAALARAVALAKPGEASKVTVWRDRQQTTLDVKLGEMPSDRIASAPSGRDDAKGASSLGLAVQPVTPEIARQLELKNPTGVVVTRVEPSGPAAAAGVQRGDVITEIDRKPVKSLEDFEKLMSGAAGKHVLMRVQREGSALYIAMGPASK